MQVTETLHEGLKRGFTVTLTADEIEGKRAERLAALGRTLRIPGFRPGKVPAQVVRQRYGSAVMQEVVDESVEDATRELLSERGLRAAGQPRVNLGSVEEKQDLKFDVEVELLPDIPMPDFSQIQLTRLKATVSDEAVDRALAEIAERTGTPVDVEEDRGAQSGDTLVVDYAGKIGDEPFQGGTGADMSVQLGGSGFIPGFAEGMEGMKPGETRTIPVRFPDEYHATELAGKDATFEITAKALKTQRPAEIDDELAKRLGLEDVGKLRDAVRERIQREYDQVSRLRLKRELLDTLAEQATFPVPESLAEGEFDAIWRRVEADRKGGQTDDEDAGKDEETLRREYRAIAERRVRLGLLLSELGRQNGIQVGADELQRAMRAEASRYPGQEAQMMEFFRKNPQASEMLRGPIFEDKAVDYVLELAQVADREVPPEELSAAPEADSESAPSERAASENASSENAAPEPESASSSA
jgi:trigger factor